MSSVLITILLMHSLTQISSLFWKNSPTSPTPSKTCYPHRCSSRCDEDGPDEGLCSQLACSKQTCKPDHLLCCRKDAPPTSPFCSAPGSDQTPNPDRCPPLIILYGHEGIQNMWHLSCSEILGKAMNSEPQESQNKPCWALGPRANHGTQELSSIPRKTTTLSAKC